MPSLRSPLRLSRRRLLFALLSVLLFAQTAATPAAPASGMVDTIYAVAFPNNLVRFLTSSPGTLDQDTPITGLLSGTTLIAIDFRIKTGQLYAIGITGTLNSAYGRVYAINPDTGAASLVGGTPFSTTLSAGANYGMDINPVVDRIRLVDNLDHNLRINPISGLLIVTDVHLTRPSNDPYVVGLAYNHNTLGGGPTTLFGIDWLLDQLVMIGGVDGSPSPNNGVVSEVGPLGIVTQNATIGFDISSGNAAYISTRVDNVYRLYAINLNDGGATLVSPIGTGANPIYDIAIKPRYVLFLPLVSR